ncbi:MAG: O-antigen ligase family protein [Prevotella sp.]|nr:O-antigen ligase family protein [Prevotella sp.]
MTNNVLTYANEYRGRALLLFLLFSLAIYQFINAGFSAFAMICMSPFIVLAVYAAFTWKMLAFWALFAINYTVMFFSKQHLLPNGIPISLYNEMLELLLIGIAIVDSRESPRFERTANLMLYALIAWCGYCTLQVLNDTCDLGINVGNWYSGARLMAFQILYIFIVFSLYISTPEILVKYLWVWALFCLFSAFWTWKQQKMGFTHAENIWMETVGKKTHMVNGIIRYFSTFNDAATYGCNAAAAAVAFFVFGITTKIKKDRLFFLITTVIVITEMFASGTRTAIVCLFAGILVYVILSKSVKIAVPVFLLAGFAYFFLAFTDIGQGNSQIRRMRSAFNKDDASANVRTINQAAIRKYIQDAPWGIGIGTNYDNVPANNKFRKLSVIPPDSEYVYIWVHAGPIGITTFIITMLMMLGGACWISMFRLKSRSLMGVGAGLCSAFVAIQLGGYANQILMQFPNCLIYYGGLSIVYILPFIEEDWIKLEEKRLAKQREKERLKLEKKLASRV